MAIEFGRLEITGSIELDQFWPSGASDADTSKLLVTVPTDGLRYFAPGAATAIDASFLFGCVSSRGALLIDPQRRAKVRLQGIDAPELHAQPRKPAGSALPSLSGTGTVRDFRQHQAETATVQFADHLRSRAGGATKLPCRFVSAVRHDAGPADAIDVYGRFVGDIFPEGDSASLNQWQLENGVALVALYDGMAPDEIRACLAAAARGAARARTVTDRCSARQLRFDPKLLYRNPDREAVLPRDEGTRRWIHPKLFRRQVSWWAFSAIGAYTGSFREWLAEHGESDRVWSTDAFLELGRKAPSKPLAECLDPSGQRLLPRAEQMIFQESTSAVYRLDAVSGKRTRVRGWEDALAG